MAKLVYKGKIDGRDVTYREHCFYLPSWNFQRWKYYKVQSVRSDGTKHPSDAWFRQNMMEIIDGDTKFIFRDWLDFNSINYLWEEENSNFQKDKLEEVEIVTEDEKKRYGNRGKVYSCKISPLEREHINKVFQKADKLYNELREKIRDELRQQCAKEMINLEKLI